LHGKLCLQSCFHLHGKLCLQSCFHSHAGHSVHIPVDIIPFIPGFSAVHSILRKDTRQPPTDK
jgi:hypothetical protein